MRCIDDEIPFKIPDSWAWCRLKNIILENIGGGTPSKNNLSYWGGNIYWASVKDLKTNILSTTQDTITNDGLLNSSSNIIPKNNIIVCTRMGIGKIAVNTIDVAINQDLRGLIISKFVEQAYFINFYKILNLQGQGLTVKGITVEELHNILIPLPSLAEQQRVVNRIEELEPLLAIYDRLEKEDTSLDATLPDSLNKSILQYAIQGKLVSQDSNDEPASALLERIREEKKRLIKEKKVKADKNESTIYKGDDNSYYEKIGSVVRCIDDELPFELPRNWCWCRLGNIGSWGAGSTPLRAKLDYYKGGTIPWLKTGELNNSIVYDTKEKITELALKECSLRLVKVNDVLIAMYGATIGKLAIAGAEMTTNQACCACTTFEGVNYLFLFYLLLANKEALIKQGEGGAQPNISREKIVSYIVGLPPINEQIRIVGKLNDIREEL
ncbi:MAG: restriction endonuclease subunit S [bacterium]